MGHVEVACTIHAPVETVWDCLNDIDHTAEWVTGLESAQIVSEGPYGLGSVYHDHNRIGPFLQITPWHVTAFEAMTQQVHESESASLPSKMTLKLTPVDDGTQLYMSVDYRLLPRLGLLGRALESLMMNQLMKEVISQNQVSLDAYLTQN
jgi:uncharacterized protein YndB with AHSA1/START domain